MAFAAALKDLEIIMLSEVSVTPTSYAITYLRQFRVWGDLLRIWNGNAINLGCDDHCTIINVLKFIE